MHCNSIWGKIADRAQREVITNPSLDLVLSTSDISGVMTTASQQPAVMWQCVLMTKLFVSWKRLSSHLLLLSLSICVSNVLIICQTALQIPLNLWILSTLSNALSIRNAFLRLAHSSLSLASRSSSCCLLGNLVWVLSLGRFRKAPWIPPFSQTG